MKDYTLTISGRRVVNGLLELETPPTPTPTRRLWLVPHDRMRYDYDNRRGGGWRFNPKINGLARSVARVNHKSYPEVYIFDPLHGVKLTDAYIELLVQMNPELSRDKALSLLGVGLAFCNGKWGVLDKPRLVGGAIVTGTVGFSLTQGLVDTTRLAMDLAMRRQSFTGAKQSFSAITATQPNILNIKTMRNNQTPPKAADVLNDVTQWFHPTGVRPDGNVNLWWRKGIDGKMYNPRMYIVTNQQIYSRLDELYELPAGFIPGPHWMPQPA